MIRLRLPRPNVARRFALPSQCAVCFDWSGERICPPCRARFAAPVPRCERCALRVAEGIAVCGRCIRRPPAYDRTIAAVDYAYPWASLVAEFKFAGALDLGAALDRLLLRAVEAAQQAPGLLLPVPLAPARLRERGFNPSWEITRRLARRLGAPADPRLLLRIRETPPQRALAPDRRAANVRGAFAVEPTRRGELAGRTVTLVDDVMTTGETVGELARVVREAGAHAVQVWVLARTPAPEHDA